jgi:hypothetical protein
MKLIFNLAIVFIVWAVANTQLDRLKKKIYRESKFDFEKEKRVISVINFFQSVLGFLLIPMGWFGIYICFNENWGWQDILNPAVWGTIGFAFLFVIPILIIHFIFEALKKL